MRDDDLIIAADVAVTSGRAGHVSLFDADLSAIDGGLKRFYAGPELLKQAVGQLKHDGFSVASVSKFGLSIMGSKKLYEAAFGVSLVADPDKAGAFVVAGQADGWLIRPQTAGYKGVIDGVALLKGTTVQATTGGDQPGQHFIELDQIRRLLNAPEHLTLKNTDKVNVRVIVIDSGVYLAHSYFNKKNVSQNLDLAGWIETSKEFQAHLQPDPDWGENGKNTIRIRELQKLIHMPGFDDDERYAPQREELNDLLEKRDAKQKEAREFEKYLQKFQAACKPGTDPDPLSHGTKVVSNVFAVAPEVKSIVITKDIPLPPGMVNTTGLFHQKSIEIALGMLDKPSSKRKINERFIISISEVDETLKNNIDIDRSRRQSLGLFCMIYEAYNNKKCIVLYATGNKTDPSRVVVQNTFTILPIIRVGGAHWASDNTLQASNIANGSPADADLPAFPDVCGLCGNGGYIKMPISSKAGQDQWAFDSGTSYATPQVAAACGYILDAWPSATQDQVREVLMRTATKITDGLTYQVKFLDTIIHRLPNGDTASPGLVNIRRAVEVARVAHFRLGKAKTAQHPDPITDAIAYIKAKRPEFWD